ncbi:unnamed protein product [Arabis nemorensis]|uniref:Uncharacterized protein n=1 Tax=Arabis nemorensis TaxID=586526 RepID=A0A565B926_9BRAS|nr:unnamed protein product [Arabis nemorensis]
MIVSSPSHPAMTMHTEPINSAYRRRTTGTTPLDPPDPPNRFQQHTYSLHLPMCYHRRETSTRPPSHLSTSVALISPLDLQSQSPSLPPPFSTPIYRSFSAATPSLDLGSPPVKSAYVGVRTGAVPTGKSPSRYNLTTFHHRLLPPMASPDLNGTRSGRLNSDRKLLKPSSGSVSRTRARDSISCRQYRSLMSPPSLSPPWSQVESSAPSNYPLVVRDLCTSFCKAARKLNLRLPSPTEICSDPQPYLPPVQTDLYRGSSSELISSLWERSLPLSFSGDRHVKLYSLFWEKQIPSKVYVTEFPVLFLAGEGTTGQCVPIVFMMILARSCICCPVTNLLKLGYGYISSSVKERPITTTSLECVHKSSAFKAAIDVLLPMMVEELDIDLFAIDFKALFKKLPVFVYDSNRLTYLLKLILTHPGSPLDSLSCSLFYVFIAFNCCTLQLCMFTN